MIMTKTDGDGVIDSADDDRPVAVGDAAVTEPATLIITPTLHSTTAEQRATVTTAKSDGAGVVDSDDAYRPELISGAAVAELSVFIKIGRAHV